ncbi:MAG: sugar transferase [Ignavibacteria bacterium]|nr:sugar transferase [Ignavibacteria bacterium]MBT8392188.1 sugar transferase [Ignavibacteria bacterium]NNJ51737.1 sugar transferase [Ignavibacteriaceae bacterium]NNL21210.1 sugar transferase [Ignavibacteriaceae bacterium]
MGEKIRRVLDIIVSFISLIFLLPLFLIIGLAIKIDSEGPVFFIHKRTGYKGKNFRMIKFRGMVHNALELGPQLTQPNDKRITRVGKFLRRTSIDEIPQFINVLKGEMSIIGPRPEITSITDTYTEKEREVFDFRPGITGISQINGRQLLSPQKRVKMEIEYYKQASFYSEAKIFFKTFKVIISNEGNL